MQVYELYHDSHLVFDCAFLFVFI